MRLARPVARDRSAARRASRRTHNMNAMLARWPFAAISLPKENPLTNITANFEFPWVGFGEDADGPPNRRRLNSVLDFYQYTDKEGEIYFLLLQWHKVTHAVSGMGMTALVHTS